MSLRVVSAMTKVTWSSMPMTTKMLEVTSPLWGVLATVCLVGSATFQNVCSDSAPDTSNIKRQKFETQFGFAKNQHQIHQISDSELKNCAMHNNRNFCSTCIILALSKMVDLSISANSFLIGPSRDQANPFNVATIIMAAKCPPSLWQYLVDMLSLTLCQYWQTASFYILWAPKHNDNYCGSQVSSLFVCILVSSFAKFDPPILSFWRRCTQAPPGSM